MVSRCANPSCSARFRFLHEGRVFKLETGPGPAHNPDPLMQKIEYFWLCQRCAETLEVVFRNGEVITQPRHWQTAATGESVSKPRSLRRRRDRD
jgi:hypothetical protein